MKYIITAKNISGDFVASPLMATEIGTEMIITRLKIIELLNTNKIAYEDTVVTLKDRFCLYENIFKNIIDFNEFNSLNIKQENIIDLVSNIYSLCEEINYKPFYKRFEQDKEQLFNICLNNTKEKYNINENFVCLLIRKRQAWPEKNLSDEYWNNLIENFKEKKIKLFIFGFNTSYFANNINCFYVDNFKDWCSLISDKNCKSVISTATGGVYPVFFVGNENLKLIIIDNTKLIEKHGHDPSFYNDCINFKKIQKKFYYEMPNNEELLKESFYF